MGSSKADRRQRRWAWRAGVLGALWATAGCAVADRPRLGMPEPVTEGGARILALWQGAWAAALAVGALVVGLIIWSVIFHRRRRHGQDIPPQTRYNIPIEVLYTVVPFLIIVVLFIYTFRDQNELQKLSAKPDVTVNVVGAQWIWAYNYVDANVWDSGTPPEPAVLYLPVGKTVRFQVTSRDVIHSFWVPAFLRKIDAIPGQVNVFEDIPHKEGAFAVKCAELCGVDHARMLSSVKVVSSAEYQRHLRALRAKGQTGALPNEISSTSDISEKAPHDHTS